MAVIVCHHHNQRKLNNGVYNQPKKIIKKPKVTNDTIFYHVTKANKHNIFGTGIFIKTNTFNTKKQLYINGGLFWFNNDELRKMKDRKLKKQENE